MLIWNNAKTFNGPLTDIHQMAEKLEQETLGLLEMTTDKILQKKEAQKQTSERKKKPAAPKEMTLLEQNELG